MEEFKKDAKNTLYLASIVFLTTYIFLFTGLLGITQVPFGFNEPYQSLLATKKISQSLAHFYISVNFTIFFTSIIGLLTNLSRLILKSFFAKFLSASSKEQNMLAMLSKTASLLAILAPFFFVGIFQSAWYNMLHL